MTGQHWTIKEVAEMLGLSEKTIRRRIKDGTLKAEQKPGKYGVEYHITGINNAMPLDKGRGMDKGPDINKGLDMNEGQGWDNDLGMVKGFGMDKGLDIVESATMSKALDIIKALQEENVRLAGQVGFLQARVLELDSRVRLLTEPKRRRSWRQRLLWWKIKPEV
jgi:excisionase family DNA binding protein